MVRKDLSYPAFTEVPATWDDGWRAKKATAASSPVRVWLVGASIMNGHKASAEANRMRWLLRQKLVTICGQGADYYPLSMSTGAIMDSGTVASATGTTLTCTGKTWGTTQYVGAWVYVVTGTAAGQYRQVISHTNTQLTVAAWDASKTPVAGDTFILGFLADGLSSSGLYYPDAPWAIGTPAKRAQPVAYVGASAANVGSLGAIAIPRQAMCGEACWISGSGGVAAGDDVAAFTTPSALGSIGNYDVVFGHLTANGAATAFQWNHDGSAYNNVVQTADTTVGIVAAVRSASSGGVINNVTPATGKVLKVRASGTAQMWPSGITCYNNLTNGVQVAHLGVDGSVLCNMALQYLTKSCEGRNAAGTLAAQGFPMVPDLVIIGDFPLTDSGTYSADVIASRFTLFIEALRMANPNVSIIMYAPYRPNGITSDSAASVLDAFSVNYNSELEVWNAVCQQYDVLFLHQHARWKGRALTNGYIPSDGEVHWTDAGHLDTANWIGSML